MAETLYQIHVRNTDGDRIAVFKGAGEDNMLAFSYRKRVRTPGAWWVQIDGRDSRIDNLALDDGLNYIWEFWRRDPQGGLDWYKDFSGLHRHDYFTFGGEGTELYVARGRGLNDLVGAEPIRYDKGSAEAYKTGASETVAKEYVDENIGPGAAAARQLAHFTVEADAGTGNAWIGDRANEQLFDVLIELADFAPGDFNIVDLSATTLATVSDTPQFQFQWRDNQWGLDCTEGNTDGNKPVIFGRTRQNITNIQYTYSRLDEVNVVYALGAGVGAGRLDRTRTASDAGIDTAWETTSWGRRASVRTSNDQGNTNLDDLADETLYKQRIKKTFRFSTLNVPSLRYGRDWDCGYLATVEHRGESVSQKIIGVTVSVGSDGVVSIVPEAESYYA